MAITVSTPITGVPQTGMAAPSFPVSEDNSANANARRWVVTANSDAGSVSNHSNSSPFLVEFIRPASMKPPVGFSAAGSAGSTPGTMTDALTIANTGYTYGKTAPAYDNSTGLATTAQVYSTVTTVPQNYKTATAYTLALVDAGTMLLMDNASPITITIPNSSSVSFPTGTRIDIFQSGAGQVTFTPAAGVTRLSSGTRNKLTGQYSAATLVYNGSNTWLLIGDLTT